MNSELAQELTWRRPTMQSMDIPPIPTIVISPVVAHQGAKARCWLWAGLQWALVQMSGVQSAYRHRFVGYTL